MVATLAEGIVPWWGAISGCDGGDAIRRCHGGVPFMGAIWRLCFNN